METWHIAIILKPLALLLLLLPGALARGALARWMPDNWLKRLLLRRIN